MKGQFSLEWQGHILSDQYSSLSRKPLSPSNPCVCVCTYIYEHTCAHTNSCFQLFYWLEPWGSKEKRITLENYILRNDVIFGRLPPGSDICLLSCCPTSFPRVSMCLWEQ